jgi:hypothetical protein
MFETGFKAAINIALSNVSLIVALWALNLAVSVALMLMVLLFPALFAHENVSFFNLATNPTIELENLQEYNASLALIFFGSLPAASIGAALGSPHGARACVRESTLRALPRKSRRAGAGAVVPGAAVPLQG